MMANNKFAEKLCLLGLALICLAGCQSVQKDILMSSAGEMEYSGLAEIEETVVRLDGASPGREELARARRTISALEGTVADTGFQAVLAAWSGRLFLMEGKNSDAQRELRKSQNLSPRNLQSEILSFKLERDPAKRLSLIDRSLDSSSGELLTERGRVLFDLNRFSESVAAFDAAFVLLNTKPFYEEAYRVFRDKAWELRELEPGAVNRTMEIARQGEITWKDLIDITRNETDFLRFITAGRDWPIESLFTQLTDREFIPYTQDTSLTGWPGTKPSVNEVVLRSGAAWFLWHLYAENRANRGILTRYSSRYANNPNSRSPIPDINIYSPFLDSVMGCVESEFISLPDGRNFMPKERVKGSEYLAMLKKL
jgi:tetratricopeptide (TPR) repeat protein